jgi:hypothetical protein
MNDEGVRLPETFPGCNKKAQKIVSCARLDLQKVVQNFLCTSKIFPFNQY